MKRLIPALTIFLGSFLVFGIQPLVGRTLLPVFGGTAAVWVVCLCAFQVFLLGGYGYADYLARRRHRLRGHLAMLLISAVWTVFVAFNRRYLADAGATGAPALVVFLCVGVLVGVPYLLLGANASLVQVLSGGNYRLYAVSNAGSLLGLLAYPFIFEPFVTLTAQWLGFAAGIALYAAFLFFCARVSGPVPTASKPNDAPGSERSSSRHCEATPGVAVAISPRGTVPILWFLIPAASCFLLNALTTHITLDVMPMPLIWTASLALFLLSYIIGFSGAAKALIKPFAVATLALALALCALKGVSQANIGLPLILAAYGLFLLAACTFLHSWLYVLRPGGKLLTRYYFLQALGGAAGGVIASLVFPMVTKTIVEYPFSLVVVALMAAIGFALNSTGRWRLLLPMGALAAMGAGVILYMHGSGKETRPVVYRARGFFGTVEVLEAKAKTSRFEGVIHEFVHGTTIHGIQAKVPGMERMPTTYYTPDASGYAIAGHHKYRTGESMRVNITGLGIGVLFAYGRTNDYYRAYEISQDALDVALDTNLFTFVSDCPAKKEIVLADARKGLEAELAAGVEPYDVIVVDAFTGDNLPYHLSTKEAFDLYFKLLKPDGILCVNISNWHLELKPFMKTVGDFYNVPLLGLQTQNDYARLQFGATCAFFCRKPDGLGPLPIGKANERWHNARIIDFNAYPTMRALPTDEKGSFIGLIKW